jgi:hypothetical protein
MKYVRKYPYLIIPLIFLASQANTLFVFVYELFLLEEKMLFLVGFAVKADLSKKVSFKLKIMFSKTYYTNQNQFN